MRNRVFALLLCIVMLLALIPLQASAAPLEINKDALLALLYEAELSDLKLALDAEVITSVELTQYYLDRIEAYNKDFNCFITMCDNALEVAAQRDAQRSAGKAEGLLFGIPVVVKDNMDVAGYHTTNGFKKNASQIASENADVVKYLLQEGAVIIAKANMSTEAQDARRSSSQAVGETKNAYSKYMAAGGSSGGSAVSTSLNFAAAALGTDTNSSLRIPAALAGCVSLRPTFGKISVKGIKKLNGTRDVPGAITRTVYDQAIMLDVLTEGKHSFTENLNPERLKGMRIGVLKQLSYAITKTGTRSEQNIDDEVAAAFAQARSELEACGAQIVDVSMSNLFTLSDKTFANNAQAPKDALYQAFAQFLADNDIEAVIYPTYLSTPIRTGYDANGQYWDAYSQQYLNNCRTLSPCAGLPEISVPIGVHSLGAGIGMEIASLKHSEQLLLDIAYSYTSRYDHRQVPAGAPNQYALPTGCDMATVIKGLGVGMHMLGLLENVDFSAIDLSKASFKPQKPSYAPEAIPVIPFVILGVGLLAAICVLVAAAKRAERKRKRRKRQPLKLD